MARIKHDIIGQFGQALGESKVHLLGIASREINPSAALYKERVAGDQQAATIGQACFTPGMMKASAPIQQSRPMLTAAKVAPCSSMVRSGFDRPEEPVIDSTRSMSESAAIGSTVKKALGR